MNVSLEVARMQMKGTPAREAFASLRNKIYTAQNMSKDCVQESLRISCISRSVPEKLRTAFFAF